MATTWIFYDGICNFCKNSAIIFEKSLKKRNCKIKPLQNKTVMKILRIRDGDVLPEMKIIGNDRKVYGGARGIIFLCKKIWWAWPLWALAHLPLTMNIMDNIYKWVAKNRHRAVLCEI
jgi:predicted DCC family thiol-disulfide oxidoreductase YuxK